MVHHIGCGDKKRILFRRFVPKQHDPSRRKTQTRSSCCRYMHHPWCVTAKPVHTEYTTISGLQRKRFTFLQGECEICFRFRIPKTTKSFFYLPSEEWDESHIPFSGTRDRYCFTKELARPNGLESFDYRNAPPERKDFSAAHPGLGLATLSHRTGGYQKRHCAAYTTIQLLSIAGVKTQGRGRSIKILEFRFWRLSESGRPR